MNRNIDASFHAVMQLNGESHDLGHTTFDILMKRCYATLASNPGVKVETINLLAARTKSDLKRIVNQASTACAEDPLAGFDPSVIAMIQQVDQNSPSPFPDITLGELLEAQSSPEFIAYSMLATQPDERVGVGADVIALARESWEEAYPEIAQHIPKWVE